MENLWKVFGLFFSRDKVCHLEPDLREEKHTIA